MLDHVVIVPIVPFSPVNWKIGMCFVSSGRSEKERHTGKLSTVTWQLLRLCAPTFLIKTRAHLPPSSWIISGINEKLTRGATASSAVFLLRYSSFQTQYGAQNNLTPTIDPNKTAYVAGFSSSSCNGPALKLIPARGSRSPAHPNAIRPRMTIKCSHETA